MEHYWEKKTETDWLCGERTTSYTYISYCCLLKLRVYESNGIWHGQIWENSTYGPSLGMLTGRTKEEAQELTKTRAIEYVSMTLQRLTDLKSY